MNATEKDPREVMKRELEAEVANSLRRKPPSRAEVDRLAEIVRLQRGAMRCPGCQRALGHKGPARKMGCSR